MQTLAEDVEPDTRNCTTERITSELSKCSENNQDCKYGLPAGKTTTYCLHPEHRVFLAIEHVAAASTSPGHRAMENGLKN
jgi:hypothetical protein